MSIHYQNQSMKNKHYHGISFSIPFLTKSTVVNSDTPEVSHPTSCLSNPDLTGLALIVAKGNTTG